MSESSRVGPGLVILVAVGAAFTLGAAFSQGGPDKLEVSSSDSSQPSPYVPSPPSETPRYISAPETPSAPRVLYDEDVAVDAGGWQSRGFTLPQSARVEVSAEGLKHFSQGFTVYVMESSELEKFRNGDPFMQVEALKGLQILRYSKGGTLAPGSWTVVVRNSENLVLTMAVHLRVVVD